MREGRVEGVVVLPNGALAEDPAFFDPTVTMISDPSDPTVELPRNIGGQQTAEGAEELRRCILTGEPPDWHVLLDGFDAWTAQHAVELRVGMYTIRRGAPVDGIPGAPGTRDDPPPLFPIRDSTPWSLPFTNVTMNETGEEGKCVQRVLDMFGFSDDPICDNPTITDVMEYCERRNQNIVLYDAWGKIWTEFKSNQPRAYHGISLTIHAVVFRGHIYPCLFYRAPEMVSRPVRSYDEDPYTFMQTLVSHNIAIYRVNDRFFVGPNKHMLPGIYERLPSYKADPAKTNGPGWDAGVPLVHTLLRKEEKSVWNLETVKLLKRLLTPLSYTDPEFDSEDKVNEHDLISVDMSKCYFDVLQALGKSGVGVPDPFMSQWVTRAHPEAPFDTNDAKYEYLALLDRIVPEWGMRTNLCTGDMFNLLRRKGVPVLAKQCMVLIRRPLNIRHGLSQVKDPDQQKVIGAYLVGICGKVADNVTTMFGCDGLSDGELEYYREEYGFVNLGRGYMLKTHQEMYPASYFHIQLAVILRASFRVMQFMEHVLTSKRAMPVMIRTDSLTYRRVDLRTPFCAPRAFLQTAMTKSPGMWHFQDVKYFPGVTVERVAFAEEPPRYYRNRTFIGPPGTGKTTAALKEPHDLRGTFSNRNAQRIQGRTMHSLFGLIPHRPCAPDYSDVAGKTVVVDEAQCLSREVLAVMIQAYENHGTSFILAMDPRQLAPVCEDPWPEEHPFYGHVTRLTLDYRNDLVLQGVRELAWQKRFVPERVLPHDAPEPYTEYNIAYDNVQVNLVNARVMSIFGRSFGDPGPYICKRECTRLGIAKNAMFTRGPGDSMMDLDTNEVVEVSREDLPRFFDSAYCTTVHKRIGSEIPAGKRLTIWGMEPGSMFFRDQHVMYTALTRVFAFEQLIFRERIPS